MSLPQLLVFAGVFFGLGYLTAYLVLTYGAENTPGAPQPAAAPPAQPDPTQNTLPPGSNSPAAQILPAAPPAGDLPAAQPSAAAPAALEPPLTAPGVAPVSLNPFASAARWLQRPAQTPSIMSISGQIDEILQKKIGQSGATFSNLHLVDLPDQSLGVVLGAETYLGIEAVPDPAARELIRAAAAEWQAGWRPGRQAG